MENFELKIENVTPKTSRFQKITPSPRHIHFNLFSDFCYLKFVYFLRTFLSDFPSHIDKENLIITVYRPMVDEGGGGVSTKSFWDLKRPLRQFKAMLDIYSNFFF